MRERFIVPFLLILGLLLYLPILKTGTFILDDGDVIAQVNNLAERPFLESFFYGSGSTYYRPVLMLSFLTDLKLWNMQPGFMHLVNILLHIGNAILVYLNVRIFYPQRQDTIRLLPLATAVLFLIHPINTESINWISGRTDPLAAFFTLVATYFVLRSMHDLKLHRFWLAALFIMLGSMSKEVAFFTFPALAFFILIYKEKQTHSHSEMTWLWRLKAITPLVLGGFSYFFMRTASFKHVDKGISKVVDTEAYQSPFRIVHQVTTDFGFYIKKLLIPQPLSLAIDYVNPGYFWFGLISLMLILLIVLKRNYLTGMVLLIALTIFPALLNALLHIAWTPYAERYLYLPAAFLCIALALPQSLNKHTMQMASKITIIALICTFLPTTVSRNWLWAEPLELTRLTHQQNPANPTVWSLYAVMLANQEFYDEARDEFMKVLEQHPGHLFTYESLASMELYIHNPVASRIALERFFNKDLKADQKILQVMLECNQERLKLIKNEAGANVIRKELIETHRMLYEFDKRPEHLLQAAELAVLNNDYDAAKNHLRELLKNVGLNTEISGKATSLLRTF